MQLTYNSTTIKITNILLFKNNYSYNLLIKQSIIKLKLLKAIYIAKHLRELYKNLLKKLTFINNYITYYIN